jgi:hypothetical protein
VTASLATGAGPLQGTVHETLSGGVATFTNLADDTAEAMTLKFAAGGLTTSASSPIVMSPSTPSKLVIATSPGPTAIAGQAFPTQPVIFEEDQFGNLETTDDSTVITASLASGSGPLQGSLTATVSGGVARFTSLGDSTPETLALKFTAGNLTSAASSTIQVAPGTTPPAPVIAPTVLGATVAMTPKTKKKKAAFSGFSIRFSAPMNLATVSQIANYQLEATTIKKKVTRLVPAKFSATYNQSTNTVTLTIIGKNPFAKGGQLTIVNSQPNGVSSQAGAFLSSSSLSFKISANAKVITPG